jgi:hypothetical protein
VALSFAVISILIALVIYPVCFAAELNEGELMMCRTFHHDNFHKVYSVANIFKMLKPNRIRWVRHVVHIEDKRNGSKFGSTDLKCR